MKGHGFDRAKRQLGDGLLTAGGPLHVGRRRVVRPAFHRQRIEAYAPCIVGHAARWRERWQHGVTIDVASEMRRLTLAIVGEALFGTDLAEVARDVDNAVASVIPSTDGLVSIVASRRRVHAARHRLDVIGWSSADVGPVAQVLTCCPYYLRHERAMMKRRRASFETMPSRSCRPVTTRSHTH